MISFCKYSVRGPRTPAKVQFLRVWKARSGILERTEVLHLVVVRVQQCVAWVSLSSHEESSPPRVVPSMLFINLAMLVILWVYGLCRVVDMGTMLMISWD